MLLRRDGVMGGDILWGIRALFLGFQVVEEVQLHQVHTLFTTEGWYDDASFYG